MEKNRVDLDLQTVSCCQKLTVLKIRHAIRRVLESSYIIVFKFYSAVVINLTKYTNGGRTIKIFVSMFFVPACIYL